MARATARLLATGLLAGGTLGVLAGPASAGPSAIQPTSPHAASFVAEQTSSNVRRELVGTWLGPYPGPDAACGNGYSEWFLYATTSYTSTWNSQFCGGSTAYGRYTVNGSLLVFHQQSVPGCATCTQFESIPVTFRFLTYDALRLCDYPSGACYMYYRQK